MADKGSFLGMGRPATKPADYRGMFKEGSTMDKEEVTKALDASPAFRVTDEAVNTVITGRAFHRLTATLTVCVLTLRNGFTVTGESACASAENYRRDLGKHYAFEDAKRKVDAFEAYAYLDRKDRELGEFLYPDKAAPEQATDNSDAVLAQSANAGCSSVYDDTGYRRSNALQLAVQVCGQSTAQHVVETAQAFERYMTPSEAK